MKKENKLPPFISVFHHQHGLSVTVLKGDEDQREYWKNMDGFEDEREDHYVEEFPLPDSIVRACNAHDELVKRLEWAESFIAGFENDETQPNIAEELKGIRAALKKAGGR